MNTAAVASGKLNGDLGSAVVAALPELFTLAESATKLRMGESTLRGIARRGEIGHTKIAGRLMFTAGDLSGYLSRHRREAKT